MKKKVTCKCPPTQPFYVRYINEKGGLEFFMFQKLQSFERTFGDVEVFERTIQDFSMARTTTDVLSKRVVDRVRIGAANLTKQEFSALSQLVTAPAVWWYNERLKDYVGIVLDKAKVELVTELPTQTIELEFILPTVQLAI